MIGSLYKSLDQAGIKAQRDYPLAPVCSFKTGGFAELACFPDSPAQLAESIRLARNFNTPVRVVGSASNILFPDGVASGLFIFTVGLNGVEFSGNCIYAHAGTPLIQVCRCALENSLSGLEFAYGIPGSVGGGVYMNCGAYGGEIKDVFEFADILELDSLSLRRVLPDEAALSYRHSAFMDIPCVIVGASFKLVTGDPAAIRNRMTSLMESRREKQPLDKPSAGSFFKRPEGGFASKLIDECGLKGISVGDAQISPKHAGFIVNNGKATSEDIKALAKIASDTVFEKTGIRLEPEVRYF